MRRGWNLIELMAALSLGVGFALFAFGLSLRLSATYAELSTYAGDLERATRQLDAIARDARAAFRATAATPDGALQAGPGVLILERPDRSLVVYRLRGERLERLSGAAGAWVSEDLGRAGELRVARRGDAEVALTLGLVARGDGPPALLSTATRCRARRLQ